ncbi:unnamed protein product [Polarella glacialis]|uniref:Uncharacterized protein n=1 Tax=Polarella glacialis TaxID=89957 RepID=A0A813J567_POLGL|nr:unnamed protein product [Polarella glacialis]
MVGCLKLVNCTDADPRTLKPCIYDVTNCTNIAPGKNCSLSCQFPFSGGIGHGKCPVNNTNPKQPLLYTWPDPSCALNPCPDPLGVVPEGYERNSSVANGSGSSSWQCRSDHVGKPLLHCEEQGWAKQCLSNGCLLFFLQTTIV